MSALPLTRLASPASRKCARERAALRAETVLRCLGSNKSLAIRGFAKK
ncbi:MAG: hypothetical protein ACI9FZ_001047 [Bacteroidia bacterium]|jgi:hypothetical protein